METNIKLPKLDIKEIEKSLIKTYHKVLFRPFIKAIQDYKLIEPNDKIAVAISGGKDSLLMAKLFQELKKHDKFNFEVVFISMNPGFLDLNQNQFLENCKFLNIDVIVKNSDIFNVIEKIAKESPCYLCARMRRGFLYNQAKELGCNKLALGHHFDDVIETTLLNIFYGGQFKTMVPKIKSLNFEGMELIRPLFLIKEKDIIRWQNKIGLHSMDCGCKVTALKLSSKRREVKELIQKLRTINPDIDHSIFKACENVNINALLGYIKDDKKYSFNDIYEEENDI
ncbi:hypothetical protein LJC17_04190 [Acholeplasma sp. OttesenSCG-928-E16]|nr:hypothetical protein [Acholeplasma sp. OttesenSCG-928-E16]